jgi:hypothetical protein
MVFSDSIAGTLFTIHEANETYPSCHKASTSLLQGRAAHYIH